MTSFSNKLKNKQPVLMAILNITPDSFSDGQPQASVTDFVSKARSLIEEGADILDVGAESTRPGADAVDVQAELGRVLPFIEAFRKEFPDFPISLDTKKTEVIKAALPFGIQIWNDVSFLSDPQSLDVLKDFKGIYVLMHSRGDSQSMGQLTDYQPNLVQGIQNEFTKKLKLLQEIGFPKHRIWLDLGFGFAKTPQQCVQMMESLSSLTWLDYEYVFGISRKRFIQEYTGPNQPLERDLKSAELAINALQVGHRVIRTHNIVLSKEILKI